MDGAGDRQRQITFVWSEMKVAALAEKSCYYKNFAPLENTTLETPVTT